MRILLVEDDERLGTAVSRGLREEEYQVDWAVDAEEARLFVADRTYAVIILDRMLPGDSGDAVVSQWRSGGVPTPVLMLTALGEVSDRVEGLSLGADDYLCKPFAFEELLARIEALSRRNPIVMTPVLQVGDTQLDGNNRAICRQEECVLLTPREYAVLEVLMRRPGTTVPREIIVEQGWGEPWDATDNALEAHIKNIRRKLRQIQADIKLETNRGVG